MIEWRRLLDLPLLVILMGVTCAAMLLPAGYALALRQLPVARGFLYSGLILFVLTAMIGVATANHRPRNAMLNQLVAVIGAYLVLPVLAAVPLQQAMPELAFGDAWFEMLSCFTTTGATLFDAPADILLPVHFWRALVGWLGGFFILLSIIAVLAPMGLGGAELTALHNAGEGAGAGRVTRSAEPSQRFLRTAALLFPPYVAITCALWLCLLLAGDTALVALSHAMATLSTSGISPLQGLQDAGSGWLGEAFIFTALGLAVSRRFWPRSFGADRTRFLWQDPELQLALLVLAMVVAAVVLQIGLAAHADGAMQGAQGLLVAAWGAAFTALSFLTTTGFQSASWPDIDALGLILVGLAIMGGGAATAAGGVKLLRVYALLRHGERELERIVHPHSIGGHGPIARRLRREGAYLAWIFFMIFGLLLFGITAALTLTGLGFEQAMILSIASITTTGQLAAVASEASIGYVNLTMPAKAILGMAMVLGRLEILAIFAVLAPNRWRR